MTLGEWISIGTALAALAGPAITYGMLRQKVMALEAQIGNLATKEGVHSLEGRVAELETEMKDVPKLVTAVAVMETKFDGFQKLYDRDAQENKHALRGIRQILENASWAPRARRRTAAPNA